MNLWVTNRVTHVRNWNVNTIIDGKSNTQNYDYGCYEFYRESKIITKSIQIQYRKWHTCEGWNGYLKIQKKTELNICMFIKVAITSWIVTCMLGTNIKVNIMTMINVRERFLVSCDPIIYKKLMDFNIA